MEQTLGSSTVDRLKRPVPGGVALTAQDRRAIDRSAEIPGWGSDLDVGRRPGVPRDGAPELGVESLYPPIERQRPRHRIHKSTEHGQMTPVFGTSCPPRGISGRLRDYAYRFSEGRLARWMTLLLADRVDMIESAARDVAVMRPPNLVREMGLRSEWRYNRKRLLKVAGATALALAIVYATRRRYR